MNQRFHVATKTNETNVYEMIACVFFFWFWMIFLPSQTYNFWITLRANVGCHAQLAAYFHDELFSHFLHQQWISVWRCPKLKWYKFWRNDCTCALEWHFFPSHTYNCWFFEIRLEQTLAVMRSSRRIFMMRYCDLFSITNDSLAFFPPCTIVSSMAWANVVIVFTVWSLITAVTKHNLMIRNEHQSLVCG